MKHLILLLTVCTLFGCSSLRQVQLVREVQKDTVYLNKVQYDSVFVSQDRFVDRTTDTIYIRDVSIQYRYKLLRDTVRIVQIDSIPVIREVEVVREPVADSVAERSRSSRSIPGIYKASLWLCIGLLLAIILFIAKKFFL